MRRLIAVAALLVTASSPAAAGKPGGEDPWASQPTEAEFAEALPADVRAAGGRVLLRCKVDSQGAVSACRALVETPAGKGAAQALIALAPRYRLKLEAIKALAPDGEIVIGQSFYKLETPPEWRRRPTPESLRAVWPTEAWKRGRDGRATINCLVAPSGSLYDCAVLSESPSGENFGVAAIALTPQLLMWPAKQGGQPVVSDVSIPVAFKGAGGVNPAMPGRRLIPAALPWTLAPSISDVASLYPPKARAGRVAGYVSLNCRLEKTGRLKGCEILREEPKQQGFGAAAKALSSRFQLDPGELKDASLTGVSVNLPIAFDPNAIEHATPGKALWTRTPDYEALKAALADLKAWEGQGQAVLECMVGQGGHLETCRVASEQPNGSGLGQAALALQKSFGLTTWSNEGLAVIGGAIRVPVRFDIAPAAPPAQAAAAPKP